MFPLSRAMLIPNFIAIAQSWPIPSYQPKISEAHNSPAGGRGVPHWGGLPLSRGRYLPTLNQIRQTVWRQSTHFAKIGPQGHLRAHNTPFGGRSGPNLAGVFPLSRSMLVPNFIAIAQCCLYRPREPKTSGPHNSPMGWGLLLSRVGTCQK